MEITSLMPNANTGVLIQPPLASDFAVAGETGIVHEVRLPSADWTPFIPTDEMQVGVYFDTMACVTFSALNCIEMQVNFMRANNMIPQMTIDKLTQLGFFDTNGKFNCSDRFTAKMSGTTRQGNYMAAVWDSIRNHGLLPEKDWNYPREQRQPVFDWNDYYKEIPQELKAKALLIKEVFDINYEWVVAGGRADKWQMIQFMKMAPLHIATAICSPWNTPDVIKACSLAVGHATSLYRESEQWHDIFDHYNPFRKRLANDYSIPWAIRGVVYVKGAVEVAPPVIQVPEAPKFKHAFNVDIRFGERSDEVRWLQDALKIDGTFPKNVISTGFYGNITAKAVYAFQTKYKVASPQELISLKGQITGKKTRAKLNQLFNK